MSQPDPHAAKDRHVHPLTPDEHFEVVSALGVPSEPRTRPAGSGWAKVTEGRGSPRYGHSELHLKDVTERRA